MRDGQPIFAADARVAGAGGASSSSSSSSSQPQQAKVLAYDVPFVPTEEPVVAAMMRMAGVTADDVVIDLGCGDGRLVLAAARRGARALGVEIDAARVKLAGDEAARLRLSDRATFVQKDLFQVDLTGATVVMLYLLPSINLRLRPRLMRDLAPGARVVSNYFDMGDWQPDAKAIVCQRAIYKWVIPAAVEGTWRCVTAGGAGGGADAGGGHGSMVLRLRRVHQLVTGTAVVGRCDLPVLDGRLLGRELRFKLADLRGGGGLVAYAARVEGKTLRGTFRPAGVQGPDTPVGEFAAWRV